MSILDQYKAIMAELDPGTDAVADLRAVKPSTKYLSLNSAALLARNYSAFSWEKFNAANDFLREHFPALRAEADAA